MIHQISISLDATLTDVGAVYFEEILCVDFCFTIV